MRYPEWAPVDLVRIHRAFSSREPEHRLSIINFNQRVVSTRATTLRVLRAVLEDNSSLRSMWENLGRRDRREPRRTDGEPKESFSAGVFLACIDACEKWDRLPKLSKSETRDLYRKIAKQALEVSGLLHSSREERLNSVTALLEPEHRADLERGYEIGFAEYNPRNLFQMSKQDYVDAGLSMALGEVSHLLFKLSVRADELSHNPPGIPQPKSSGAQAHHFVRELSSYFSNRYRQPLHAHVAALANAVVKANIDESHVRALIRADRAGNPSTREKVVPLKLKNIG